MADERDHDAPLISDELAAHIARVAAAPTDPREVRKLHVRLRRVQRETEEKYSTPRLAVPENRARIAIKGLHAEKDGDLVAAFRQQLHRLQWGGSEGAVITPDVEQCLVQGFVKLIEGFDASNHRSKNDPRTHTEISNQPALDLRDSLLEMPSIRDRNHRRAIVEGLAGCAIGQAIKSAARLGITMPSVSQDLFFSPPAGLHTP